MTASQVPGASVRWRMSACSKFTGTSPLNQRENYVNYLDSSQL